MLNETWGTRVFKVPIIPLLSQCSTAHTATGIRELHNAPRVKGKIPSPFRLESANCQQSSVCILSPLRTAQLWCLRTVRGHQAPGFSEHVQPPVAGTVQHRPWDTGRRKDAEEACQITGTRNDSLDTLRMVIFQVKLSTAFCSLRSFRPSLVPILCRCSWNSMAERDERQRRLLLHPLCGGGLAIFVSRYC